MKKKNQVIKMWDQKPIIEAFKHKIKLNAFVNRVLAYVLERYM